MTRITAALLAAGIPLASPAHADPDDLTTPQEVCGGFNLGLSPSQIAGELQRNDGRENEWKARRDTNWPIIEGDCG